MMMMTEYQAHIQEIMRVISIIFKMVLRILYIGKCNIAKKCNEMLKLLDKCQCNCSIKKLSKNVK